MAKENTGIAKSTDNSSQANAGNSSDSGQTIAGTEDNSNFATKEAVDELSKQMTGLTSLVGKFSNEIGEVRKAKETSTDGDQGTTTQQNQNNDNQLNGQSDPKAMTVAEKSEIENAWKRLDQSEKTALLEQAPGEGSEEKLGHLKSTMLTELRKNMTFLPDSLFDEASPKANDTSNNKRNESFTAAVVATLLSVDPKRYKMPGKTGDSQSFAPNSFARLPNAVNDDKTVSGDGGILGFLNKK